ncbi:cobalt-precorrin-6A reductase [Poseidonocella sedimentorum]|uniref:Precorrin-6A reductase n=1 Tax=Poseidonocella sedimentorum TaxID=871652 RepID=A0A1I6EKI5_9RHOB|nr:cobalt-precorrin-6A reductase [Poseidonocella sedimentorum]SFR18028.1 precorrin-6A reductase [Poseidonocella sedimentorum]
MRPNLLVLGGTTEATALCRALHAAGIDGIFSLAGRVERPLRQPLPMRSGGFGGVAGLVAYIAQHGITHLVDATHPFAAQMSANAVAASATSGTPLIALTRAPWGAQAGDDWREVADMEGAVAALPERPARIMLAIGRLQLGAFAARPQHDYLLRLVDPPDGPLPVPKAKVLISRGPFTEAGDLALLRDHRIEMVVSKNAGGAGAYAKIAAARALHLPVIMVSRPVITPRREVFSIEAVLDWLAHSDRPSGADRGV